MTESNFQSLTALEWALRGEVVQLARCVGELRGEVARMCQEGDCKMEDVLFERDSLQVRLDATASQPPDVCKTLTMVRERLEQHSGRAATSQLQLE